MYEIWINKREKSQFLPNSELINDKCESVSVLYNITKNIFFQVSDVNDDVRRAAVTGLGFLLFR